MVRRIMNEMYTDAKDGICGNEDCGQMSAWYVFSAMGFYPVNPADGRFIIGSPVLDRASVTLPGGKQFTVVAEGNSPSAVNVSSLFFNGEKLERNYITYEEVMAGGELYHFVGDDLVLPLHDFMGGYFILFERGNRHIHTVAHALLDRRNVFGGQ